jgi:hypothetical protein
MISNKLATYGINEPIIGTTNCTISLTCLASLSVFSGMVYALVGMADREGEGRPVPPRRDRRTGNRT